MSNRSLKLLEDIASSDPLFSPLDPDPETASLVLVVVEARSSLMSSRDNKLRVVSAATRSLLAYKTMALANTTKFKRIFLVSNVWLMCLCRWNANFEVLMEPIRK
ncbi:hypothetical protein PPTG_22125 [Phytophthora nicotianae INRA-310]|uniref:Uncharacterized protein n=2 Tax=Phytophthora nicotianae TaxID=4792 RepID=W2QPL6_PHYN3|nr:hypothetical protein PPTG_22125 [Phytophthora nicotianae INRA-310]ETL47592.1 hypothetical protein L916_02677 [Phytophthora nicotianae]ETN14444.1 hypothetical protein PPTG_22125 [Phytophthora nicotianae INRA-310]